MKSNRFDLLCVFLLLGSYSFSLASDFPRTIGLEWEIPIPNTSEDYLALEKSHILKLFSFYGKNSIEAWELNLIPAQMSKSEPFLVTRGQFKELKLFEQSGSNYILNGLNAFGTKSGFEEVKFLLQARGKYDKSFQLRKNHAQWLDKQPMDDLIGDVVSEEWNELSGKNYLSTFEFPMNGSVTDLNDILKFRDHLWSRLGVANTPLAQSIGHVHWVPSYEKISENEKQELYQNIINYWGDVNDATLLASLDYGIWNRRNGLKSDIFGEPSILHQSSYELESEHTLTRFSHVSFAVLTQSTFERLHATSKGILIDDREKDLNLEVDPNFPPIFKRSFIGIRGIYGQKSLPKGQPIPVVGLEARSLAPYTCNSTIAYNLKGLPKDREGSFLSDGGYLSRHARPGKRGLLHSLQDLGSRANVLGLPKGFVDDVDYAILNSIAFLRAQARRGWTIDQIRAFLLIPANDWLSHPWLKVQLEKKLPEEQNRFFKVYNSALEKYVARVKDLFVSRTNPKHVFRADWMEGSPLPAVFSDQTNRIYSRKLDNSNYLTLKAEYDTWDQHALNFQDVYRWPDDFYITILSAETSRFISESGIALAMRLTQWDDVSECEETLKSGK